MTTLGIPFSHHSSPVQGIVCKINLTCCLPADSCRLYTRLGRLASVGLKQKNIPHIAMETERNPMPCAHNHNIYHSRHLLSKLKWPSWPDIIFTSPDHVLL
ncbi:hypothetical protein AVEN_72820-1 [Araneus ventricosus]|uniref:Uncharacterized protein n=1 Tax=Araneus ventricosus TaxID=182803 RepID=A0A4Y2FC05_ARAVE|nr:hypothetical protein AVEN_193709-1 [Araneus ventricosus]GBM38556.1 hypothetical protein AVEN_14606-1 [Araneus ventricosus]GBM38561.1 hypothetical protein AVEN_22313-1 [Araneus ventricosus]GBM38588.1 hypothetical protein AVEN_72820-1 [Araneus ventricosus]